MRQCDPRRLLHPNPFAPTWSLTPIKKMYSGSGFHCFQLFLPHAFMLVATPLDACGLRQGTCLSGLLQLCFAALPSATASQGGLTLLGVFVMPALPLRRRAAQVHGTVLDGQAVFAQMCCRAGTCLPGGAPCAPPDARQPLVMRVRTPGMLTRLYVRMQPLAADGGCVCRQVLTLP